MQDPSSHQLPGQGLGVSGVAASPRRLNGTGGDILAAPLPWYVRRFRSPVCAWPCRSASAWVNFLTVGKLGLRHIMCPLVPSAEQRNPDPPGQLAAPVVKSLKSVYSEVLDAPRIPTFGSDPTQTPGAGLGPGAPPAPLSGHVSDTDELSG